MAAATTHVAIDIGTSSGTCVLGAVGPETLTVEEVHRFDSRLLDDENRREWHLEHLIDEILVGIEAATARTDEIESIGIDATAAGFGFVADGKPMGNPAREGVARPLDASHRDAFFETGHRRLPLTYYYQQQEHPEIVENADWLLLAPQLLGFLLGGNPAGEVTYAISGGLGSTRTWDWATPVLEDWGLPTDILPPTVEHGESHGRLSEPIAEELSLGSSPAIRTVAGHDTSSAVAAIPFSDDECAFLATGSWFIPGFELEEPVISDTAFETKTENVGGIASTSRFVRNIQAFSILERFRRHWSASGYDVEYDRLLRDAAAAPAFETLVDTTDERVRRGEPYPDVSAGFQAYCTSTDQPVPREPGVVTRCLLESLAAESAVLIEHLAALSGESPSELRLVGGGAKNAMLCQFVADALNVPVLAGAPEATAIGNLLTQAMGAGTLESLTEARAVSRKHIRFDRYDAVSPNDWQRPKARMATLLLE